jgi:WD40 repeat protein
MLTLCSFDYLETTFRACGLARLLSIFEECLLQILDHDLMVIFEQVLLPAVPTLVRDPRQFVSEFLNTLRYTRAKNSVHLNNLVEQAMQWTDNYASTSLLVPLTCWISPPKIKQVLTFSLPQWKSTKTIIQPTRNHQHLLVAGNENDLKSICKFFLQFRRFSIENLKLALINASEENNFSLTDMFHLASQYLIRTFSGHQGSTVSALCASNDGQFFISTALDGTIKLWNLNHPEALKTLQPAKSKIFCAIIGSSDQWIAIGSSDSSARIVNIETGDVTHNFKDHTGPVCFIHYIHRISSFC